MDMQQAARDLQRGLGLPLSVATVMIWQSPAFTGLKVWIDGSYSGWVPAIPARYEGFAVKVERRPRICAR